MMGGRSANDRVRLALPSKGQLEEPVKDFLAACGLTIRRTNPRQYTATLPDLPQVDVLFQRVPDIVTMVEAGGADLGITGYDLVAEAREESVEIRVLHPGLGIARCFLALAVPDDWLDVSAIHDLADLAAEMHGRGRVLRVATKFPDLARDYLYRKGITHFTLVPGHGALESAPTTGAADVIADLVSTGTTLRDNGLKMIDGGTILASQGCFIGNRQRLRDNEVALATAEAMLELIEAHLRARGYFSVTANVRARSSEAVARHLLRQPELAGLQGPTVSKVFSKTRGEDDWYAVHVIVQHDALLPLVGHLRRLGGMGIAASRPDYVFDAASIHYQALTEQLKRDQPAG